MLDESLTGRHAARSGLAEFAVSVVQRVVELSTGSDQILPRRVIDRSYG